MSKGVILIMRKNNPLITILKKIQWPILLIIVAILISSIGSLIGLIVPLMTGNIVDDFSKNGISGSFIIVFILLFALNAILGGIGQYLLSKIGERIIYSIRSKLFSHIIYLRTSFFDKNQSGQLMSRIVEDTAVINYFISQQVPSIFPAIVTVIGSVIMLFILDWKMTLLTCCVIPLFFLIMIPIGNFIQKLSVKTQLETANFSGLLGRVLSDIRLVKTANNEIEEIKNANKNLGEIYKLGLKQAILYAILNPFIGLLILLTIGIILGFGGIRVANDAITAGTLISMIFYVIQLSAPITNFSTVITDYKKSIGASERINEIFNEHKEASFSPNEIDQRIKINDISFENVSFAYESKNILNNLSFHIPSYKTTAIVGPSGSGKTTIFNLIERLYEVNDGVIKINDTPIENYNIYSLRKEIAYVIQNNPIMEGSIQHNLTYGIDKEIPQYSLKSYTKFTDLERFIENLEDGYETLVGERGIKLSGGQKQKINITKAFIQNPQILLLDEATSNLDSESEQIIQDALEQLIQKRTTVIIAHRLSTIKKADQIIFLDNGNITGIGKHDDLIKSHDKYKKFVNSQKL